MVRWWCLAHPAWVFGISTVPWGCDDHPTKEGWTASYTEQFGPNYAEKRRWMGPGGRLCRFDNTLQDGDNVGAAEAANSRHHQHPMPDLAIPPRCLPLAIQQRKKKTIQAGLFHRLMAATNTFDHGVHGLLIVIRKTECKQTMCDFSKNSLSKVLQNFLSIFKVKF